VPVNPIVTPIDYTSRDYASLREDLITAVQLRLPDWTAENPSDFGLALLEAFAYMGDIASYYVDRAANEAFLPTATRRESLSDIAKTLGYYPSNARSASVTLQLFNPTTARIPIVSGTQFVTNVTADQELKALTFEIRKPPNTSEEVPPTASYQIATYAQSGTTITLTYSGNLTSAYVATKDLITISGLSGTGASMNGNRLLQSISHSSGTTTMTFTADSSATVSSTSAPTGAYITAIVLLVADEGVTVLNENIGKSNGGPDQEFILNSSSVIEDSVSVICGQLGNPAYSDNIVNTSDPRYGAYRFGPANWTTYKPFFRTTSVTSLGETDAIFYLETNNNNEYVIRFGDGTNGLIPTKDSYVYVTYRVGGGTAGNIPAGVSLIGPGLLTATTFSSSFGGAEKESLDSIRRNAASMFRTRDRAVSNQDFSDLALTDTGVSKASARSASSSSVTLYLFPPSSSADIAPGYTSYRVSYKARDTSGNVTLTVEGLPSGLAINGKVYVSGISSTIDSITTPVTLTGVTANTITYTTTPPTTGNVISETSCTGVVIIDKLTSSSTSTGGITSGMSDTVSRVKKYIEQRCNAGTTLTVSPVRYRDVYIDVTIYLEPTARRSVGMRKAKDILVSLFSPQNNEIAQSIRAQDILVALAASQEIGYSEINDLWLTDSGADGSTVTAGTGEMLRLLDGKENFSISSGALSIDTYTNGNIIIRIGGDTGIIDF
jgi:hypothetical protein